MAQPGVRHQGRKWYLLGASLFVLLGASLYLKYHGRPTVTAHHLVPIPIGDTGPLLEPRAVTLAPGIHLLGGLSPAAAYVVETSAGLLLIDAGLEPDARQLKQEMAPLGLDWHDLKAILLTHAHGDHSGGAGHLRRATGARVYAGAGDAAVLRAGGPREALYSIFSVPADLRPAATPVDVELRGDEVIELGDARVRALAAPGHTPGSVCYLLIRGSRGILFSGDVIMSLAEQPGVRSPLARRLGTYAAYLAPAYRGDARSYARTLRALRALPAPDWVLPGHPRNSTVPQPAGMSQRRWEGMLDAGIREMDRLQERFLRDGANFLDGVPKRLLAGLYYLGDFHGGAVYGVKADSEFVLVNAPGGAGLSDFVTAGMEQLGLEPATPSAVLLPSAGPKPVPGLADLAERFGGSVAADPSASGFAELGSRAATAGVPAEVRVAKQWSAVGLAPPGDRGAAPFAYQFRVGGKSVLFTGQYPIKPVHGADGRRLPALAWARAHLGKASGMLGRLREINPDLWLPAVPAEGQNANLDVGEWTDILDWNEQMLRRPAGR